MLRRTRLPPPLCRAGFRVGKLSDRETPASWRQPLPRFRRRQRRPEDRVFLGRRHPVSVATARPLICSAAARLQSIPRPFRTFDGVARNPPRSGRCRVEKPIGHSVSVRQSAISSWYFSASGPKSSRRARLEFVVSKPFPVVIEFGVSYEDRPLTRRTGRSSHCVTGRNRHGRGQFPRLRRAIAARISSPIDHGRDNSLDPPEVRDATSPPRR